MDNSLINKKTLLDYYQENEINPVVIQIENKCEWVSHVEKRKNLYCNHLKIPLTFFKERSIIEFGCNSGENALYLASLGASLTLVEPNVQVMPRLKALFKEFNLEKSIENVENLDIKDFDPKRTFDMVVAEGFLHTLEKRDEMLLKICKILNTGGLGLISYDDMYGSLMEMLRVLIFQRVCRIRNITSLVSEASLEVAESIFLEDYNSIKTSRPFKGWWLDNLANPYTTWNSFWTYKAIISIIEVNNCQFYSSSPQWSDIDKYSWYKNVLTIKDRHKSLLESWNNNFIYFITGFSLADREVFSAPQSVVYSVSELIKKISQYLIYLDYNIDLLQYPKELEEYLSNFNDSDIKNFNRSMKELFISIKSFDDKFIIDKYHSLENLRNSWGTALHYICFSKNE